MSGRGLFIGDVAPGDVVALGPSRSKGEAGQINSSLYSLPFPGLFVTQANIGVEFILNFVRNKGS